MFSVVPAAVSHHESPNKLAIVLWKFQVYIVSLFLQRSSCYNIRRAWRLPKIETRPAYAYAENVAFERLRRLVDHAEGRRHLLKQYCMHESGNTASQDVDGSDAIGPIRKITNNWSEDRIYVILLFLQLVLRHTQSVSPSTDRDCQYTTQKEDYIWSTKLT